MKNNEYNPSNRKPITWKAKVLAVVGLLTAGLIAVTANSFATVTASNTQSLGEAVQVATGRNLSAVLTKDGKVFTRGQNVYGQLGTGDFNNRSEWTQVNFDKPIKSIDSGSTHILATAEDGTIYTWGENRYGITGNGNIGGTAVLPVSVTAAYRFDKITSGKDFVVATGDGGRVYVWGNNENGQLGTGDKTSYEGPHYLPTPVLFNQIQAGSDFTLALDPNGYLWGWGNNDKGQLGNGTTENISTPTQLGTTQYKFLNVSLTSKTVTAIDIEGYLWTWGDNSSGQLGNGVNWRQQQIDENARVAKQIADIKAADVARRANLINVCIAEKTTEFQINNPPQVPTVPETPADPENPTPTPTPTPTPVPVPVPDFRSDCTTQVDSTFKNTDTSGIIPRVITEPALNPDSSTPVQVTRAVKFNYATTGSENGYAVDVLGRLYSWGSDANGQSGINTDEKTHTQVPVIIQPGTSGWTKVAAGDRWAVAVNRNSRIYSWGLNTESSLATANPVQLVPTEIGSGYNDVYAAPTTGYAVNSNGELVSWGNGKNGSLGTSDTTTRPALAGTAQTLNRVTVTAESVLALNANNNLFTWGKNSEGTFSNGEKSNTVQTTPVVQTINKFENAQAGDNFTVALDTYGNVWAWGNGSTGSTGPLGGGGLTATPALVPVVGEVKLIAAGRDYGFAITKDNIFNYWGGNNSAVRSLTTDADIVQISAGTSHATMLDADNQVHTWGTYTGGLVPEELNTVEVMDPTHKYKAVTASTTSSYGIREDGSVVGWGYGIPELLFGDTDAENFRTIADESNFIALSTSGTHGLAVSSDGIVYGWGLEPFGSFGNVATVTNGLLAVPVNFGEQK